MVQFSKISDSAPTFIYFSGKGGYSIWGNTTNRSLNIRSSYSANISLLFCLFDAIYTGPGFGIIGVIPKSDNLFSAFSIFNTSFTYSAFLKLKGTPLSLGYQYSSSELDKRYGFNITQNEFFLCFSINNIIAQK